MSTEKAKEEYVNLIKKLATGLGLKDVADRLWEYLKLMSNTNFYYLINFLIYFIIFRLFSLYLFNNTLFIYLVYLVYN